MPPTINATLTALLYSPSFSPPVSARWINGLFFSSLIVSLVAALFGIMAKQWIREYLKWNAPLANPRENILVRQIRFESWETWNVEAFIWSIPVLQELAMILFLVGIVILVWTLDNIVAILVTTLVALLLVVLLVVTVLPIFVRRCPFKSPTSWVFVRLADVLRYVVSRSYHWVSMHIHQLLTHSHVYPHSTTSFPQDKSWRTDDIDGGWDAEFTPLDDRLWQQLAREATHLGLDQKYVSEPSWDSLGASCIKHFSTDVRETPVLIRALDWVSTASPNDSHITACIDQCMLSIRPPKEINHQHSCPGEALTYLCTFGGSYTSWKYNQSNFSPKPPSILTNRHPHGQNSESSDWVVERRKMLGVVASEAGDPLFSLDPHFSCDDRFQRVPTEFQLRLLAADLHRATSEYMVRAEWIQDDLSLRMVFERVSMMLQYSLRADPSVPVELRADEHLHGLRSILLAEPQHTATLNCKAVGLRTIAFILACRYAQVSVNDSKELVVSTGSTDVSDYQALLSNYLCPDLERCSEDDLNMLVFAGLRWLGQAQVDTLSSAKQVEILQIIRNGLEAALARNINPCRFLSYFYEQIPLWRALMLPEPGKSWFSSSYVASIAQLLHVMTIYYRKGLCDFWMDHEEWHTLLAKVHHNSHCQANSCPWSFHSCEGDQIEECPLLKPLGTNTCSRLSTLEALNTTRLSSPPDECAKSPNEERSIDQSLFSRAKTFLHGHLQVTRPIDEESGTALEEFSGNSLPVAADVSESAAPKAIASTDTPPDTTSPLIPTSTPMILPPSASRKMQGRILDNVSLVPRPSGQGLDLESRAEADDMAAAPSTQLHVTEHTSTIPIEGDAVERAELPVIVERRDPSTLSILNGRTVSTVRHGRTGNIVEWQS